MRSTDVGVVEMVLWNTLSLPDDERAITLGEFHRARDAEVARSRAQDEKRRERAQKEQQRQRQLVLQEEARQRERKALQFYRQKRLERAERERTNE